jgi:hypothetical protein
MAPAIRTSVTLMPWRTSDQASAQVTTIESRSATPPGTSAVKPPRSITISKEANLRDITRATAHEVAEIQKLLVDPNAVHNDALKKGSTSTALTAHDEGRLAELNVLLYELADRAAGLSRQ